MIRLVQMGLAIALMLSLSGQPTGAQPQNPWDDPLAPRGFNNSTEFFVWLSGQPDLSDFLYVTAWVLTTPIGHLEPVVGVPLDILYGEPTDVPDADVFAIAFVTDGDWRFDFSNGDRSYIVPLTDGRVTLPADKSIEIFLHSSDYVYRMEATGRDYRFDVPINDVYALRLKPEPEGQFMIICEKVCGRGGAHLTLTFVPEANFKEWLARESIPE